MPRPVTNPLGRIFIRLFITLAVTILCLLAPLKTSFADDVSDSDDKDFEDASDSMIG